MSAQTAENYWQSICDTVSRLRCWVRLSSADAAHSHASPWGQLLIVPTEGYLEACSGPVAMRQVQWVQIAPIKLRGGLAGRPVEFIDLQDQTETALREAGAVWTLREEEWSVEGVFTGRPLTAIHIANPFNGRA